jgi:hypothetical protein
METSHCHSTVAAELFAFGGHVALVIAATSVCLDDYFAHLGRVLSGDTTVPSARICFLREWTNLWGYDLLLSYEPT